MSRTACLAANCITYEEGGGHLWVYMNWAFGLRALGWNVVWLESAGPSSKRPISITRLTSLQRNLRGCGLDCPVALYRKDGEPVAPELAEQALPLEAAFEAELLLNLSYSTPDDVVRQFQRSALVDIDPGLLQVWISERQVHVARHHRFFSIGEGVCRGSPKIPDCGITWQHTPPCVALEKWPVTPAASDGAFTTISHWYGNEWVLTNNESYSNDKRTAFLPFLELPRRTAQPLELSLYLGVDERERKALEEHGWRVRESSEVARTPELYQRYVQESRGEFSCAKPSCVRLDAAWISDRTLCYLASGKPAVVQHTGPSDYLPDAAGLFRFSDLDEAVRCIELAAVDYENQCRLARALAEEYFDAPKVIARMLERVLD